MSTNPVSPPVKLTKPVVDIIAPPAQGQCIYRDAQITGFGLRLTANGTKSFIVEKRILGCVRRITLDHDSVFKPRQACCDKPPNTFTKHGKLSETRGKAYANLCMGFLRAVLNLAKDIYDDPRGQPIPRVWITRGTQSIMSLLSGMSHLTANKQPPRSAVHYRYSRSQTTARLLLLLCGLCATQTVFAADFNAVSSIDTGSNPISVTSDDFNGDNYPDLAVVNASSNTVSVLINNGDGTFAAKVDYGVGANPQSVISGDFNGDHHPDLAVVNYTSNTVSVLINNGDGTFAAKVDYGTGSLPISVTSGDFNGDNRPPDLAVVNAGSNTVSVLINNGDGTYAARVDYDTGARPISVTSGDFDGHNHPDLAVANYTSSTVSVLINNGDGTYAAKVDYGVGSSPTSITSGDFNGDNHPDLAVANYRSNTVSVLINNGDGTYAAKVDYGVGTNPQSLTSGDFNGDNHPDLAVANYGSNNVTVLYNNGDGTYAAKVDYDVGTNPQSIASGDFNGDNYPDLAVANNTSNTVSVLTNTTGQTPDAFSFVDQTDVPLNTMVISNAIILTGLGRSAPITVSGGEYSINGGAYTASPGTVGNSDTVTVRQTSSTSYFAITNTVLTVGGGSDTFSVTTLTDTEPDPFSFAPKTNVALNKQITSGRIIVTGITASAVITVSGGSYDIEHHNQNSFKTGAFTSSPGLVNNNAVVVVRQTSSANYDTTTNTVLTIGGVSGTFSVTTLASGGGSPGGGGPISIWMLTVLALAATRRLRLSNQ